MAVKSFRGRRTRASTDLQSVEKKINVSDYMTRDIVTFHPEQYLVEVIQTLLQKNISGGPVVDDDNKLVGIISEGDCLKEISDCRYHNYPMENIKVKDHMIKRVETIDGNMNVLDAANKFLETRHRRFPIVEDGKLVGLISQRDVLNAAMRLKEQKIDW